MTAHNLISTLLLELSLFELGQKQLFLLVATMWSQLRGQPVGMVCAVVSAARDASASEGASAGTERALSGTTGASRRPSVTTRVEWSGRTSC